MRLKYWLCFAATDFASRLLRSESSLTNSAATSMDSRTRCNGTDRASQMEAVRRGRDFTISDDSTLRTRWWIDQGSKHR
jgi:hypothetical protein